MLRKFVRRWLGFEQPNADSDTEGPNSTSIISIWFSASLSFTIAIIGAVLAVYALIDPHGAKNLDIPIFSFLYGSRTYTVLAASLMFILIFVYGAFTVSTIRKSLQRWRMGKENRKNESSRDLEMRLKEIEKNLEYLKDITKTPKQNRPSER